jgi:hypothetical protein
VDVDGFATAVETAAANTEFDVVLANPADANGMVAAGLLAYIKERSLGRFGLHEGVMACSQLMEGSRVVAVVGFLDHDELEALGRLLRRLRADFVGVISLEEDLA